MENRTGMTRPWKSRGSPVGGCLVMPLQGAIIDLPPVNLRFMELASVRASILLPALCCVVIAASGLWVSRTARRVVA
jgi:fucose permease